MFIDIQSWHYYRAKTEWDRISNEYIDFSLLNRENSIATEKKDDITRWSKNKCGRVTQATFTNHMVLRNERMSGGVTQSKWDG